MTQPISELELLKQRMNEKTDESLESTRRMVGMCDESQKVGAATLTTLHHQGEQLDNVNVQMDNIHATIKGTETELDRLEKCCGLFVLPWKKTKRPRQNKEFKQRTYATKQPGHRTNHEHLSAGDPSVASRHQASNQQGYITRITNDAREDEMDQNLGYVANTVGELRTMALEMGNEVSVHNRKLDDISAKAEANKVRLNIAQNQAERIVGKPKKPESSESVIPTPGLGMLTKQMASQALK